MPMPNYWHLLIPYKNFCGQIFYLIWRLGINSAIDMLMRFYRNTFFTLLLLFCVVQTAFAINNDSLYAKRLKKVDSLNMGYHPFVSEIIAEYLSDPKATAEALGRYQYYKPFLDSVMRSYNIPTQVGLYALAASGIDFFYKDDESGNCGPWALQFRVARMYGLKMNTYVDERMDFESTTLLAGKYLKELHLIYNSWPMVMAAFTTNTLTINKFIRKSGNTFDYWVMYDSLPTVAQNIVPAFIGAMYIYNYSGEHGITPKPYNAISYDTVRITKWMSFEVLAPALHTTVATLQSLNPIFKKGIVPYSVQNYILKLPKSSRPWYADIDNLKFEPYNSNPYIDEVPELADKNLPKPKGDDVQTGEGTIVIHTVVRGQGLGIIAQKYGVKVDDLRKWNNIKGYTIYPNQKLKIIRKGN